MKEETKRQVERTTGTHIQFADDVAATTRDETKEDLLEERRAKQQEESHAQELTNKHPYDKQGVLVGRLHRETRRRDTNGEKRPQREKHEKADEAAEWKLIQMKENTRTEKTARLNNNDMVQREDQAA